MVIKCLQLSQFTSTQIKDHIAFKHSTQAFSATADQMGSYVRRLASDYLGTIEYLWTTWGLLWDYLGGSIALGLLHWVAPLGLLFSIKVQWVSFQRMDLKITMHLWWVSSGLTPLFVHWASTAFHSAADCLSYWEKCKKWLRWIGQKRGTLSRNVFHSFSR